MASVVTSENPLIIEEEKSPKKKPIPLFIFIFLAGYFALVIAPFLAAGANPAENINRLNVLYTSFDNSTVGTAFLKFMSLAPQKITTPLPNFQYVDASSVSDLQNKVLNQDGWAAMYVSAGATKRLNDAIYNGGGCGGYATYDPSQAIGIIWDEGRYSQAENQIFGYMTTLVPRFTFQLSSKLLGALPSATINQCIAINGQTLLSQPTYFQASNLSPVYNYADAAGSALYIGNILIAVFASLYLVNALVKGVDVTGLNNVQRAVKYAILVLIYTFGLAAVYATVTVGLVSTFNGHLYSGSVWAQAMAIQWCHGLIWAFGMMAIGESLSYDVIAIPFGFLLVSNIIGGWNTALANPPYHNFYQVCMCVTIKQSVIYSKLLIHLQLC